ncbi:MAG: hypothetical protein R3Y11_06980 [Pseudomonadota bacterium]
MAKSTTQKAKATVEPVEAEAAHLEPLSDENVAQGEVAETAESVKTEAVAEPVIEHSEPPLDEGMAQVESPSSNDDKQDLPLLSLTTLADSHRVASWQQAALLRLMGWEDDKLVTDADYVRALESLKHRHMGGGRFMSGRKA